MKSKPSTASLKFEGSEIRVGLEAAKKPSKKMMISKSKKPTNDQEQVIPSDLAKNKNQNKKNKLTNRKK